MTVQDRREREKEQRRQEILTAAEVVFFSKGYKEATVDEIAARAELSKGAVYLYFSSKEEMAAAIVLKAIQLLNEAFRSAAASCERGLDKIGAIGQAFFKYYQEKTDYAGFMRQMSELAGDSPAAAACNAAGGETFRIMADAISSGQQDGSIRPDLDPLLTALTLASYSQGVLEMAVQGKPMLEQITGKPVDDFFQFAFAFMERGLQQDGTAP